MEVLSLWIGKGVQLSMYRTGIYKQCTDSVYVTKDGIDGDENCFELHGGVNRAIHQYPSEHYYQWNSMFGMDSFQMGCLGENISSSGMVETDVYIGDKYQIGDTVVQVTQPRAPCMKTDHKMGIKNLHKELAYQSKCGWFYKVLETGNISEGDKIVLIEKGDPELSVSEVGQLLVKTKRKDKKWLQKCINDEHLDQFWKDIAVEELVKVNQQKKRIDRCKLAVWWVVCLGATAWVLWK